MRRNPGGSDSGLSWRDVAPRIWIVVTLTASLAAGIVRTVWSCVGSMSPDEWAMRMLLMIAAFGACWLILRLVIAWGAGPVGTRSFRIGVWITLTAAFVGTVIHMARYIPSAECSEPLSFVIAALLLVAAANAYVLGLWRFARVARTRALPPGTGQH